MRAFTQENCRSLPEEPGVYRYLDKNHTLIYVGKAKNIKKRVSSYLLKNKTADRKTRRLIKETAYVDFILAHTEFDALLLENNLIKESQPKFNILLKDDKTFPYICILKERFPRIISTRKFDPKQGAYFGPYSSVSAMNNILELIRKVYTLRTCNLNLSKENIKAGKFKVCLEYHIGNCKGPCEDLQSEADYNEEIAHATQILKGDLSGVKHYFQEKMTLSSDRMEFEQAQSYKEKLELVRKFQTKSIVVNPNISDMDVIALVPSQEMVFVNYMKIKSGAIIFSKPVNVKKGTGETDAEILTNVLYQLREEYGAENKEVISNLPLTVMPDGLTNSVPKIGDKHKLVTLCLKNALQRKKDYLIKKEEKPGKANEVLYIMKDDLRLKELPIHIECFDNSNLQGSDPVASMVCFRNGKPSKSDYRKFHIKTVTGPDDFASMEEVVTRRYKRLLDEGQSLPQLIVIDGGKGQLSSAATALKKLGIYNQIPIIGIAKRLEEIYFPEDQDPLFISKRSPTLQLIQKLRDEAHRFAINFHRQSRSKTRWKTSLSEINGIGPKTADQLLRKFKSVKKIKELELKVLEEEVGAAKAKLIFEQLHKNP